MRSTQQGFIMLTTVLLVALLTALGTYLFQRSMVHIPYMLTMINREKTRMIALSGVDVTIGQMVKAVEDDDKKEPTPQIPVGQNQKAPSDETQEPRYLISLLNHWQIFSLRESIDGINGELGIFLTCEDGKLPINEMYDFKKHAFKNVGQPQGDREKVMQDICTRIEKKMGGKGLFEGLSSFLKNRKNPLDDVSELLAIPSFKIFKNALFREPQLKKEMAQKVEAKNIGKIYLSEIFTIASGQQTLQPWAFSPSLLELFEYVPEQELSPSQRKERLTAALKNFKKKMTWPADWKASLGILYGKDFTSLPNSIQSMLDTTFEPETFSVVVYSTVNGVTQRLFSLIERQKVATKSKKKSYIGKMKRLYWF